jgi:23S rRNA (guanosine2251-2'-O)-methyltransferase
VSGELVTGRRAVVEALRAGQVREVLVAVGARDTQGLRAVREAARAAKVPVRATERRELDRLAHDHRGVVAHTVGGRAGRIPMGERDLATFPFGPDALVVVLDGITDPQNLGAAARTAEAAGAAVLVTRARRAAAVTPAAVRASAGALEHLPHAVVANIARALARLQDVGFSVVGLDDGAPRTIFDDPCPDGRVAVVIGSEGEGMSRLVRERCDVLVALPVKGRVETLNASSALAAALYGFVLPARVVASPH